MIVDLIHKGLRNPFWRNVGMLTGGTVIAQAIMVFALPILTRLFSPDDFNLLAVYASTLGLLTVASCLRFNIAIPLPQDDRTAMDLLLLSLLAGGLFALLAAVPAILMPENFAEMLGQKHLQPYLWLLPIGVLFAAAYDALQYWASRKKRYASVAQTRMTRAIGGVGTQIGMGTFVAGPSGLLIGHMLLSGIGFVGLSRSLLKNDKKMLQETQIASLRVTAVKYRQFPVYSVPEALFNTAGTEISILVIAAAAAGPEAGFLMLAMRVIGIPMNFVGTSVAQVWMTDAPEKMRAGKLADFTKNTMISLARAGSIPLIAIGATAPFLFPLIFGSEWGRAGEILAWLTPMFILQFIVSPVSSVPHIMGKVDWAMWLQGFCCIVRLGSVLVMASINPELLVEAFALSGGICYLFAAIMTLRYTKAAEKSVLPS